VDKLWITFPYNNEDMIRKCRFHNFIRKKVKKVA